jgi:hypothetical protein
MVVAAQALLKMIVPFDNEHKGIAGLGEVRYIVAQRLPDPQRTHKAHNSLSKERRYIYSRLYSTDEILSFPPFFPFISNRLFDLLEPIISYPLTKNSYFILLCHSPANC